MSKRLFLAGIIGTFTLLMGCSKDNGCRGVPVEDEKARLEAFNSENGVNGTYDARGFFFEIIAPGSTNRPQQVSTLFVRYKGMLLTGEIFDQQNNPGSTGFPLNSLIDGWKYGLPMIGKGGKIKLTLPSALSYGCQGESRGDVAIPPNAPLFFEIELVDFF